MGTPILMEKASPTLSCCCIEGAYPFRGIQQLRLNETIDLLKVASMHTCGSDVPGEVP